MQITCNDCTNAARVVCPSQDVQQQLATVYVTIAHWGYNSSLVLLGRTRIDWPPKVCKSTPLRECPISAQTVYVSSAAVGMGPTHICASYWLRGACTYLGTGEVLVLML